MASHQASRSTRPIAVIPTIRTHRLERCQKSGLSSLKTTVAQKKCRPSLGFAYRYVHWSTVGKDARAVCQAVDRFPLDASKRLVPIGICAYKHVEQLWEKVLVGCIGSTFRTSDQSVCAKAAMAIRAGLWSGWSLSARKSSCICLCLSRSS